MRRFATVVLAAVGAWPAVAEQSAAPTTWALEPPGTGGIQVVDRALAKLSTHMRLLVVGAHPDDEDTTVLSLVAAGLGGEAAYLSLSRGEGGQNLIGPELEVGLGLIRTGELMAARRMEGTRQFFTRAYDFGYTRSLEETFERWPRSILQLDAVRAARRFKPQVVVAVFPADARGGHGQHQAAGVIAEDLFALAGQADRFHELEDEGLVRWQPQVLYRRAWWNPDEATLRFPLNIVDPLSGRSVFQIAAASRSMHRSQDMGTLQPLGSRTGGLIWAVGEAGRGADELFGGVDTRLAAIAQLLPVEKRSEQLEAELDRIAALAQSTRRNLSPVQMEAAVPHLAEMVRVLGRLVADLRAQDGEGAAVAADLLEEKLRVASVALAAAAGVAVDAVAERERLPLGGSGKATAMIWNSGSQPVQVRAVDISCRDGWRVVSRTRQEPQAGDTGLESWEFELAVPAEATPTIPYFLRQPRIGDLYSWDEAAAEERGEPFQTASATARFDLEIAGVPIRLEREVVHRYRDQALGEVRRPLRAVPRVEVEVSPERILWPLGSSEDRKLEVLVRSNSPRPVRGHLEIHGEADWPTVVAPEISIEEPYGQQIVRARLPAPSSGALGRIVLSAAAVLDDGGRFEAAYEVVSYPHVRPLTRPVPARAEIQRLDLDLPEVERIGYVRGASDRVPEVLIEVGLPLELLSSADLELGDLSAYDAIVVGSRAYEVDADLSRVNSRLLDYLRRGGRLVVQYQQYQFARGGYAPYPLEIARPHGRVTDETAPVRILRSEHPVFRSPNRIGESDWLGWVQERGLYFADSWDPAYTPLLSLHDPGQPEQRGALLVARSGAGTYIYTGLSFFRELPAGVPGAIRLFVNLLHSES